MDLSNPTRTRASLARRLSRRSALGGLGGGGLAAFVSGSFRRERATARQATPDAGTPEPGFPGPGVGIRIVPLAGAPLDREPPFPATLGMARLLLEPGAHQDVGADPGPTVNYVESGAVTLRIEGPVTIIRADAGGEPTPATPGTDVTFGPGDAFFVPAGAGNAMRNDGSIPAVILGAAIFPCDC